MAKRGNGEGTITQVKPNLWMGRIVLGRKADGSPNRKSVYGNTKKEVIEKLRAMAIDFGNGISFDSTVMTMKEWLVFWLENFKKLSLKPKTYEVYERFILQHITPSLGHISIKDINTMNIQKLVNDKYKAGLSTASIRKMFNIINQSLSHAVKGNMITRNPAESVHLPKHTQKQIKVFTQEEQNRFLECSKGDTLHGLFVLALDTGIRLGELLALTWNDVDFDNETIQVNKNLITVKDFDNTAESKNILMLQDAPKTKASIRKVPLTKRSLALLKEMNPGQTATGLIFRTKTKNFISPRNVERSFCRIAAKAGISKCNFHTARHSYATRLFELGIPAKVVSELLGHSKVSHTLDIYTHVIPVIKNEAIRALDAFYDRQSETSGVNQLVNQ